MADGEAEDEANGFPGDGQGHLGAAGDAVGEDDGNFDNAEASTPSVIGGLDLKGVTLSGDGALEDGCQSFTAETLVASGGVHHGQTREEADVETSAITEEETTKGPVENADAALTVAGTNDKISRLGGGEEARKVLGIMSG